MTFDFVTMSAKLILEDGSIFVGKSFGAARSAVGEIVFQTGMVGYVESLSDPSYAKQFLTLTYPLIGNYGVADQSQKDEFGLPKGFESHRIWPSALIVERICPDEEYSHYQAVQSLSQWMQKNNVPGLYGIDVRQLTKLIREHGTMKAKLILDTDDENSHDFVDINAENLVAAVSRRSIETFKPADETAKFKVLAVDCGLKNNQIRCLVRRKCHIDVVPFNEKIDDIIDKYDGLFLSNGPGDPSMCTELTARVQKILSRNTSIPVFGICLGNQILARAAGAKTFKLRYGNRGHNQPCTHLDTGRCYITSQNHGYAVDDDNLPDGWVTLFRNANDGTNEGIIHNEKPFFSVQFHPEHAAGPTDMECLFDVFIDLMNEWKTGAKTLPRELIKRRLHFERTYYPGTQSKVLILGSGGLSIGQAGEFDYSGAQAIKALREEGVRTVLVNPNVATVQTSKGFANRTYFVPITKEYVTDVIKKERPTGLLCTFGGQTALNCAVDLWKAGILDQYNVQVLGTAIQSIIDTEDRERFKQAVESIGEKVAPSMSAQKVEDALAAARKIGYPVLVRAAFALGGLGSGFANNDDELVKIAKAALAHSDQVLVDKSLRGWKELEYEVVRDAADNCITVCNMENVDPLGIHTGESVVVAPSQTLTDTEYNRLRETAIKVIRHFKIIGECNIQYAVNPNAAEFYIIEVNARLSRSSALASKATGYPLAHVAAKLALGKLLPDLRNAVTNETTACFEPSLDYCVVKIPRWDLSKFNLVNVTLGSSMKSVGEVMGIGRCFEEAFQKALRMVNDQYSGYSPKMFAKTDVTDDLLENPTDKRMFFLARAMLHNSPEHRSIDRLYELTRIDKWFLYRMQHIIDVYEYLISNPLDSQLLWRAKKVGFSDRAIAEATGKSKGDIRKKRYEFEIAASVKQIDTVAGEWPAATNYLYLTYNGNAHDVTFLRESSETGAVMVLGSGVYRIGSSVEFDACCVGCVEELKRLGRKTIMVNCNPETVSTDYDICNRLYFEELSVETVADIYEMEKPSGLILSFGGQAGNNIAKTLHSLPNINIHVFGTSANHIDEAEDRYKFSRALDKLKIAQPYWVNATCPQDAIEFCKEKGYPCLIRPSYVLSGAAMNVAHDEHELTEFLRTATVMARDKPVVVSKFITDAKEIDVDAVAVDGFVLAFAISEHVENAGIHSGDATLVTPPQDLNSETIRSIQKIVREIARHFNVTGPYNMQLIAKNNQLFVIECNLRVSRSFPFVSKTLDVDFVGLATKAMIMAGTTKVTQLKEKYSVLAPAGVKGQKVGVKVPQFSFSRLAGADVLMGVEMVSTGEVGCFGKDRYEAYLKGLLSTGFVVPKKSVFISIGGSYAKEEMLKSVRDLADMGFALYASKGTSHFYNGKGIKVHQVEWPFEEGEGNVSQNTEVKLSGGSRKTIADFVASRDFDLMINLPIRGSGACRFSAFRTPGYKTRRMAVDNGIPLVTDIKCAKLYIEALKIVKCERPPMNSQLDCISSGNLDRFPGLVDIHVHVREPGQEHKETWETATKAAIAGGITTILAMPNTQPALVDSEVYEKTDQIARENSYVDYGLYLGANSTNAEISAELSSKIVGLKMYLNQTFGTLKMDSTADWMNHFKSFPRDLPIVCHAEGQTLAAVLTIAKLCQRAIHICHVSTAEEIGMIRMAKENGWEVTCEVCPHHLFLCKEDLPDGWKEVRPRLGTREDVETLWKNLKYIDCFATDHAPHTKEEKSRGEEAPPGFPGVEYMLPLLLTAVKEGKLTKAELIERLHTNPQRIFNLPVQRNTYVEVDLDEEWVIPENGGQSKAQWTPYANKKVIGRIRSVIIRGEEVYVDGNFVSKPTGKNIRELTAAEYNQLVRERETRESTPRESPLRTPSPSPTRPLPKPFLTKGHILSILDFDKEAVSRILDLATQFRNDLTERSSVPPFLQRCVMATMFYEVSTRTKCSFEAAMCHLGGRFTAMDEISSSVKKGESLEHSVRVMSAYVNVVVLRHPQRDAAQRAAVVSKRPVINAGDGTGEHPTQALLDLFTIREELSTVNSLTIALVGDLKNGRTVHSLAKLLCLYKNITLHYVSPTEELGMPEEICDFVEKNSSFRQVKFVNLEAGIRGVDLIYMTRIQRERFTDPADYDRVRDLFVLTPQVLNSAGPAEEEVEGLNALRGPIRAKPIVMHPMPIVNEIRDLDDDDRAAYFRQAENGLFVRMALLTLILKDKFDVKAKEFENFPSITSYQSLL